MWCGRFKFFLFFQPNSFPTICRSSDTFQTKTLQTELHTLSYFWKDDKVTLVSLFSLVYFPLQKLSFLMAIFRHWFLAVNTHDLSAGRVGFKPWIGLPLPLCQTWVRLNYQKKQDWPYSVNYSNKTLHETHCVIIYGCVSSHLTSRHVRRQAHGLSGPSGKCPGSFQSGVCPAAWLEPQRDTLILH